MTLTLKIDNQSFPPQLMTMHSHTKFVYKMLSCSKNNVQIKPWHIHKWFKLTMIQTYKIFFKHTTFNIITGIQKTNTKNHVSWLAKVKGSLNKLQTVLKQTKWLRKREREREREREQAIKRESSKQHWQAECKETTA